MLALTLTQPWATLVAIGAKGYETRGWRTNARGVIAITAAKDFPRECRRLVYEHPFRHMLKRGGIEFVDQLPLGKVLATVDLVNCHRTEDLIGSITDQEYSFGDYSDERFAYELHQVRRLATPIACRGLQRFWRVPADIEQLINQEIAR